MNVVAARGVTRDFGRTRAVDDVDLVVRPGEVVGLLGANGAGKTTLIKMILGLLRPTSGNVALFGQPLSRELRRRIGYVPQNLGLYADLTARENLEFRGQVFGRQKGQRQTPAAAGSHRGLVGSLPLGIQRQVAFEAATQHDPDLFILDEPTSGVSPLARSDLWDLIRGRAESGAGVLVSTHHMDEAVQADRLVVMASGRVVAEGSTVQVIDGSRSVEVTAPRWQDAFRLLDREGPPVSLAGRRVRVLTGDWEAVSTALHAAGIEAHVDLVPATLDETMVRINS